MRRTLLALAMATAVPLATAATPTTRPAPGWLEAAVFYQIYPQSFRDSNGDGIGDLSGIIEKLPYLRDLGINAVWLNPCFVSPFRDAGYDIADFYQVAPRYGTNDDLRTLFAEARRHGIRVMLDLVAGHTSDEHPWFRQSQRHERNAYSDWFVWTDSVWTWFAPGQQVVVGGAERDANFIPNFFHFQPALNYGYAKPDPKAPWQQAVDAPGPRAVRAELKKIMAFWFDLGAAGFRVDMAGSLVKNDPDGAATAALWADFRAWMDREYPDRAMVSEWSQPQVAIPRGFHMDFLLPFAKPGYRALFRPDAAAPAIFDRSGRNSIRTFLDEFEPLYLATHGHGFIAIPSGNHDTTPRLGDGRDERDCAVALAFLLTMPGVPFLYYGDEIGMRSVPGLPSKEGGYGRTACRTPMQWDASANAGFSTASATQLYLPIDPAADRPTVAAQLADPRSLLRTTQALIALRKAHPALGASGEFEPLVAEKDAWPFVFRRSAAGETILVALNPTDRAVTAVLPDSVTAKSFAPLLGEPATFARTGDNWTVTLPPVSFAIVRVAE
ncbi:MAG TPA: alpha-amylase family glycosyl hydrolase [Opitutaceae bacterium]|nr:alpha-amylase family glycosyl hydrolase [Opitutaceae bacterium]